MTSDVTGVGRAVGRYEIVRPIGQGAMATVHLARQLDLDRDVALKELDRVGIGQPAIFASRFLREARLAGSLSHPNIVTVYEYLEHDGRPFIAMEHAERGSLRGHIGGLSLHQIFGVLESLLAALTHAEERGIVHRDIKPENILVTADGRIKIGDFGIASAYSLMGGSLLTATGTTVGTPMYMAPEQATGKQISIATDLYAVGIVAFEMLFGDVPFSSGESALAMIWQQVNEPLPDLLALRPELDPALCRWLEQLLAKDAGDRPPSAAAALDALEEIALDVLGNRWRRAALLLPSPGATTATVAANDPAPPSPGPQAATPRSSPTRDAGATRDAAAPGATRHTGAPTTTARHAMADRKGGPPGPVDTASPTPAGTRRPRAVPALVAAAAIVATAGGYLTFQDGAAPPAPARNAATSVAALRYAGGLASTFTSLNRTRVPARKRLADAKTGRAQAVPARALASAYRAAAKAAGRLSPPADQRAAATRLTGELGLTAKAYDALAVAARAHRPKTYALRRRAVHAHEDAVRRAADALVAPFKAAS